MTFFYCPCIINVLQVHGGKGQVKDGSQCSICDHFKKSVFVCSCILRPHVTTSLINQINNLASTPCSENHAKRPISQLLVSYFPQVHTTQIKLK